MTDLEKECLTVLLRIRDAWTRRFVSRDAFMEIMGAMVQTIKHLESKQSSCPTGSHFGPCDCKPAIIGHAQDWKYQKKNRTL
jgi:hypothetical protein